MQQSEKRYSNGILLRGLGETKEKARAALKEAKVKYNSAMKEGLNHFYFKTSVGKDGQEVKVNSPGMMPYRMSSGKIGLRMEDSRTVPVLTPRQDVFENTYREEDES